MYKKKNHSISLGDDLFEQVKTLAQEKDVTCSWIFRAALKQYLAQNPVSLSSNLSINSETGNESFS
ncbi:ribbon-helix-helix domain-containing protein [Ancylothrix sp. D3o]|uniref:ribbon-helix-helix domain-containing protein n=1 Tax=Ancylothrix sp. D3o TaxID=2953691 RepID=UPI0035C93C75